MAEITRDDIISYIQDNFQMKVTVQDLTRPTGIFVVNVCNLFLSGFGIQQTDQPSFDAQIRCQPSEFEVQRETQLMINVFSRVRMIVEQVNFHVLLVDFVRPTPKRIHALLIALCQSHARYIHINNDFDELRQQSEQIFEEKQRFQTDLVDAKSEYEGACIALNTLNVNETDAQKAEVNNIEEEISQMNEKEIEKTSLLKGYVDENRKLMESTSYFEIEAAQKKDNIRVESDKIILSPMKIIDFASSLRSKKVSLQADLKNLTDIESEKERIFLCLRQLEKDTYKQLSLKAASFLCELDKARSIDLKSKQVEDEIDKIKHDTHSIDSQVSEMKKVLDTNKTDNHALDKIKAENISLNELSTCLENDLPKKRKVIEDLKIRSQELQDIQRQFTDALNELPEKEAYLRDKYFV